MHAHTHTRDRACTKRRIGLHLHIYSALLVPISARSGFTFRSGNEHPYCMRGSSTSHIGPAALACHSACLLVYLFFVSLSACCSERLFACRLFVSPSFGLPICLYVCLSVCLSVQSSAYPSVCFCLCMCLCLSVPVPVCAFVCLFVCLPSCLSACVCLSLFLFYAFVFLFLLVSICLVVWLSK